MASAVVQSIPAGSTATNTAAAVLDIGEGAKPHGFVAVCTSSAGVSAGAFQLQVSNDNSTWETLETVTSATASGKFVASGVGIFRYVRAVISTTVVGGTVGITVQNV